MNCRADLTYSKLRNKRRRRTTSRLRTRRMIHQCNFYCAVLYKYSHSPLLCYCIKWGKSTVLYSTKYTHESGNCTAWIPPGPHHHFGLAVRTKPLSLRSSHIQDCLVLYSNSATTQPNTTVLRHPALRRNTQLQHTARYRSTAVSTV